MEQNNPLVAGGGAVHTEVPQTLTVPVDRSETVAQAREMAYIEKPARDLEIALDRERNGEQSIQQEKNVERMNGLLEMFPHAFEERVCGDGENPQRVLIIKDVMREGSSGTVILTRNGIFEVFTRGGFGNLMRPDTTRSSVDFAVVSDHMGESPITGENWRDVRVPNEKKPIFEGPGGNLQVDARRVRLSEDDVNGWKTADLLAYIQKEEKAHEGDPTNQEKIRVAQVDQLDTLFQAAKKATPSQV